ncbi:GNAT family N-acetyltransferase [Streptomyces violaceusniger]|uniref:GNAT family N-acetyltransferase n=1 Tax=Streptomyces violaceusniger TaxID=68280 RepID=UPI0037F8A53E
MTDTTHRPDTVHALLADGSTVEIRPARPQDRDEVLRMHQEMSPEAMRLRFFAVNPRYAQEAAERICAPGHRGYRALVALADGRVVGWSGWPSTPCCPQPLANRCPRTSPWPSPRAATATA